MRDVATTDRSELSPGVSPVTASAQDAGNRRERFLTRLGIGSNFDDTDVQMEFSLGRRF